MSLRALLKQFRDDQRGVAALEMAIVLPIVLTMFMGVMEIANFTLANQRADKMAYTIADLVAQNENITPTQINSILGASTQLMNPFPFGDRGHVILTAVHRNPNGNPYVAWQYEGGGTLHNTTSNYGSPGFPSVLPQGFSLAERETVVIAEVYYSYPQFITDMFGTANAQIYKYAFYKPRLGGLDTVQTQ